MDQTVQITNARYALEVYKLLLLGGNIPEATPLFLENISKKTLNPNACEFYPLSVRQQNKSKEITHDYITYLINQKAYDSALWMIRHQVKPELLSKPKNSITIIDAQKTQNKSNSKEKNKKIKQDSLASIQSNTLLRKNDIKNIVKNSPGIYKSLIKMEPKLQRHSYNIGIILTELLEKMPQSNSDYEHIVKKAIEHLTYAKSAHNFWSKKFHDEINLKIITLQKQYAHLYYTKQNWQEAYNYFSVASAQPLDINEKTEFLIARIKRHTDEIPEKNDLEYACSFFQEASNNNYNTKIQKAAKHLIVPCAKYIAKTNEYDLPLQLIKILLASESTKKHGIDMLYITQEKLNSNQKDAWHCHLFSSNIYDELQYNKNNSFECDTLVTLGYIFYTKQNKPYTMQNCLKDKKQAIEYMSAALKKASKPNKQSITTFLGDIHYHCASLHDQNNNQKKCEGSLKQAVLYGNTAAKLIFYKKKLMSKTPNRQELSEAVSFFEHYLEQEKTPDPEIVNLFGILHFDHFCSIPQYPNLLQMQIIKNPSLQKAIYYLEKGAQQKNHFSSLMLATLYSYAFKNISTFQKNKYSNIKKAIEYYTEFLTLEKEITAEQYYLRGSMYYCDNQFDKAEKDLTAAIEMCISPEDKIEKSKIFLMLGTIHLTKENQQLQNNFQNEALMHMNDEALIYMDNVCIILDELSTELKKIFAEKIDTNLIITLIEKCSSLSHYNPTNHYALKWHCTTLKIFNEGLLHNKQIVDFIKKAAENNSIVALYTLLTVANAKLTPHESFMYANKLLCSIDHSHPYSNKIVDMIQKQCSNHPEKTISGYYLLHNHYKDNPEKLCEILSSIKKETNITYQPQIIQKEAESILPSYELLKQYADEYVKNPTNEPLWKKNAALLLGAAKSCSPKTNDLICASVYLQKICDESTPIECLSHGIISCLKTVYQNLACNTDNENLKKYYLKKKNDVC